MKKGVISILFNVFANEHNVNAQSLNARDIAIRLNPLKYDCYFFASKSPDPRLVGKSNMHIIRIPRRYGSSVICYHHFSRRYDLFFYLPHLPVVKVLNKCGWMGCGDKVVIPIEGPVSHLKGEYPIGYRHLFKAFSASRYRIPISQYVNDDFIAETCLSAYGTISVGIDTTFFSYSERKPSKRTRILYVGRLIQRKGPQHIIEAARRLSHMDFALIGSSYGDIDGAFESSLRRQVFDEKLKNVEFLGQVSQEKMRELMWQSDIFLLPSRVEGIPKVTLEAAATGLPCIVFDDYRTPSIADGVTGFQVKTFEELFEKLKLLVENGDLRLRMGAAAAAHAKKFDWDIIVKQWEEVFEKVIADRA